jgi:transcriptional regulator with XRE-family HTH domain
MGRRNKQPKPLQPDEVRMLLKDAYHSLGTYQKVADELGMKRGTIGRIVKTKYFPKKERLLRILGVETYAPRRSAVTVAKSMYPAAARAGAGIKTCSTCRRNC